MENPVDAAIREHSLQAQWYKWRTPYFEGYFGQLAKRLQLTPADAVLDVCCGQGQLAAGLSPLVRRVHAIDGSAEMLASAPQLDNVTYHCLDVNRDVFRAGEPLAHFVVGRAIHYLEPSTLTRLCADNLAPGGAIVTCFSTWAPEQPWARILDRIVGRGPGTRGSGRDGRDLTGAGVLDAAGFARDGEVTVRRRIRFTLNFMVKHVLSVSYGEALARRSADIEGLRREVAEGFAPFLQEGRVSGEVLNGARIYRARRR